MHKEGKQTLDGEINNESENKCSLYLVIMTD